MPPPGHHHNRFCPLSMALDVLGDPWSLLVVRALMSGPRQRESLCQFLTGLDGSALNETLAALVSADVIRCDREDVSQPDATFELTARGASLAPVLESLTTWGLTDLLLTGRTAQAQQNPDRFDQTWTMADVADPKDEVYAWTIDGTTFALEVAGMTITRKLGRPREPAATLDTSFEVFDAVLSGRLPISEALMRDELRLSGSAESISRMFRGVGFPPELLDAVSKP